jgi:hypothetical protein
MKHSEVKGKTVAMSVKTIHGEEYLLRLAGRLVNALQPGYYDLRNQIEVESRLESGQAFIKLTAGQLVKFVFNEEEAVNIAKAGNAESFTIERDERVNRYKVVINGFCYEQQSKLPEAKRDGDCLVTFRAGGDYTVKRKDSPDLSYGDKLKASDFTDNGFQIEAYDGSIMVYTAK